MAEDDLTVGSPFKLHVGIDFGTDGSGLAYALPNGDVFIHNKWKSKKYGAITKPKTQILLNEEGKCVAFGIDASDVYSQLDAETQQKWLLFERFKMALYENINEEDNDEECDEKQSQKKRGNKISIKKELTAMNGKKFPSEKVFVEALKYLKSEAQKYFRKLKIGKVRDMEIQWILTVPAIWNDYAENQMREWAIAASLIDKNIENQLMIVFEPDCASLAIQHKIARAKSKQVDDESDESHFAKYTFSKGQKYILIDAGGGTVDIAFHEILGDFGVKECHHPSGGPWGSCYIDDEFITIMNCIFSEDWMNEFKHASPNIYTEMLMNFRSSKNKFDPTASANESTEDDQFHNIRVPYDFLSFLEEKMATEEDEEDSELDIEEAVAKMVTESSIQMNGTDKTGLAR
eukprot:319533_1